MLPERAHSLRENDGPFLGGIPWGPCLLRGMQGKNRPVLRVAKPVPKKKHHVILQPMTHSWDERYIYLLTYHKSQPNVGKYTSPMDPMGREI